MSNPLLKRAVHPLFHTLDFLAPYCDLLIRCWIAYIFLRAGLSKVHSFDTTLTLFTYEYQVPLLSPYVAAVVGTAAELILPVMLVLGFGSRLTIVAFFIYNVVAVVAYRSFLWTPEGAVGLEQHIYWGLLLAFLMFHGPGKISLDHLIAKRWGHQQQ